MSGESFLSRWSRRKEAARAGDVHASETERESSIDEDFQEKSPEEPHPQPIFTNEPALPVELPAIESLTPDADFTPFMAREVDPALRNQAMKKLFSDPHFNAMDGLDVYIDDYSKPDPLPLAMLRKLHQAKSLFLFEGEDEGEGEKTAAAPGAGQAGAANSAPDSATAPVPAMARTADEAPPAEPSAVSAQSSPPIPR